MIDFYFGGGLNYYSPFNRKKDMVGIAIAHANLCKDYYNLYKDNLLRFETAIELNYALSVNKYITIQPNVQYIINPGMSRENSNSLVTTLRLSVNY